MTSRWKLLSSLAAADEVAPVLSVEFLALVTGGSATTYTGTIDCSSVTSSDSLIILTQAEAGGGTTNNVVNNITANATSMITDIATTNSTGAGHTAIFRVEGSAVAGDSTTDISMTYNNGMARQSFIAYRLVNGSNPTLGDTDDTQTVSTNPITSTVSATAGDVIFSSAYFSDNSGHDFSISNGTLTETDGVQSTSGSGGGMFSTDAVGSVTVSYTNSGTPNTQGDSIVTAVYTGGFETEDIASGLSSSLLTISGTNDAWTTQTVDISAYAGKQVYLVFRYLQGNSFTGDIQLDSIQLDGTTYSFENQTHNFEVSDSDIHAYDDVSWVALQVQENISSKWQVDLGGTPSSNTGRTDADAGSYYVYAETSSPAETEDAFWMRSPLVTLSSNPTLQFAEARSGDTIGRLDVYLEVVNGDAGAVDRVEFLGSSIDSNSPSITTTIDGSSVTASDLFVVLYQAEENFATGGSTFTGSVTTTAGTITLSVAASNSPILDRTSSGIFYCEGTDIDSDSTTSVSINNSTSESGISSIQCFRLVGGSGFNVLDSAAVYGSFGGDSITTDNDFSSGILFASASSTTGPLGSYISGIEDSFQGWNSGGHGLGGINKTPGKTAHTVTYDLDGTDDGENPLCIAIFSNFAGGTNNPPTATNDTFSTDFETSVSGNVLTNDTDPDNDTLIVTNNTNPSNGSVTVNSDGSFTYTPNTGFSGTDSFTYTVSDGNGGTANGTVTITVSAAATDFTPDAVDWNNLSTGGSSATTNTQTISGINTTITLEVNFTEDDENYTLQAFVNGSGAAGPTNSPGTLTFSVSNGDTVYFTASGGETRDSTATVINTSDGNATLDTFGIDLQN